MGNHLKQHYGPAEGPLGFPQTDRKADDILHQASDLA